MTESFNDRLEAYLKARPGLWLNGMELAKVGGQYAWRSRVSEVRRRLEARHAGTIENRQRRMTNAEGKRFTVSEYRYASPRPASLLDLVEQASCQ